MKIKIDPMTQLRLRAERAVNFHCVVTAQDLAHDRKRQLARWVFTGGEPSDEFVAAAAIEGKTPRQLAAAIVTKPDVMMERENARRALIVAIRAAPSPEALRALLDASAIPEHPGDRTIEML